MIRIALRSERRLFRDALAGYLSARPECTVVGSVADVEDLPVLCELRRPDVVLVDIGTGLGDGRISRLGECVAKAVVVVVYERLSTGELGALWRLGIDTLLPCSHGLDALLVVLRRHGTADRARLIRHGRPRAALTEQEEKIITLLGAGHTVERIAQLLGTTTSGVANAKRRIYRKLDVASKGQAVAKATALGIVSHSPLPLAVQVTSVVDAAPALGLPELTARECDILRSIANGDTVRQTARGIGIAEKTVENTQARMFRKLGVRNRAGALAAAYALGLVDLVPAPRIPT